MVTLTTLSTWLESWWEPSEAEVEPEFAISRVAGQKG